MSDYGKIQSVDIHVLASAAYAAIKTDGRSLDVELPAGQSASAALREVAEDLRKQARRLLDRAALIDNASDLI